MKNKIKELRIRIDGLSQLVKELKPFQKWRLDISKIPDGLTLEQHLEIFKKENVDLSNSIEPIPHYFKELEKSYDSLILAKAWLGKVLGELGQETPYKNDGNRKDVKDIEKTADTVEVPEVFITITGYKDLTHIEKVDWLREEIKRVINYQDLETIDFPPIARTYFIWYGKHLCEARFWLGFELGRIKENG